MRKLLSIFIFCMSLVGISQTTADKVLDFAKKNMGKKIDRGECWDLANAALNNANAQWGSPFNFGDKLDYKKLGLKPGDVLQFTNVKFVFPNGSASFPKHTAIVYAANKNKVTTLVFAHQLVEGVLIAALRPFDQLLVDFALALGFNFPHGVLIGLVVTGSIA